ncbi:hypothetical protein QQ045_033162 [Rhodiola kirilowii]
MAVLAKTTHNAAAAMENKEVKRSRKRPNKASLETKSEEDDSNVELINSSNNKKKKRQATTKHVPKQHEVVTDIVNEAEDQIHNEPDSITTQEGGVEGVKHGYCIVPSAKRFLLLHSFLKRNLSKKVVVICSSWQAAKFYTDLLKHLKIDSVYFHGKMDKEKSNSPISKFSKADSGILFTDFPVEGLEFSDVDWCVQYDPPDIPQGWTGSKGNILTFLTPNELQYLNHLQDAKVQAVKYEFESKKLSKGEPQLEKLVSKNHHLYTSAVKAYRSYIIAYHQRSMKDVFNVDHLDLLAVVASFCFSNPPKIHLD